MGVDHRSREELSREFAQAGAGVGVIITNKKRSLFYLQQKDDQHPIKEFRLTYTTFGGVVNSDEPKLAALKRELFEELGKGAAQIVIDNVTDVVVERTFNNKFSKKKNFLFTLFESVVSDALLHKLARGSVKEGRRGVLVSREQLKVLKFIESFDSVFFNYLKKGNF